MRTVLVTGASGCVGHHATAALLDAGWRVRALVRDPARLRLPASERLVVARGDVVELAGEAGAARFRDVDAVVHLATAWGDAIAYRTNVDATLALARLGVPMVHFSTASILDGRGGLLPEAEALGTDYVRSKALAWRALRARGHDNVMTVFPTLVVGGEGPYPASHLGRTLADAGRWLGLARALTIDGSFHLIHAQDLARMSAALLAAPRPGADLVAGNAALTADAAIAELCAIHGRRRLPALDVTALGGLVARVAGDRMSGWDRFCMRLRHFGHDAVNPRALGLAPGLETLGQMCRHEGWGPRRSEG